MVTAEGIRIDTWLTDADVSDGDLKWIAELPSVDSLWLDGTAITERGIHHLLKMKNLNMVTMEGTRVTRKAYHNLRQAMDSRPFESAVE